MRHQQRVDLMMLALIFAVAIVAIFALDVALSRPKGDPAPKQVTTHTLKDR